MTALARQCASLRGFPRTAVRVSLFLALLCVGGWAAPALHAATFTVNTTVDAPDAAPGDGRCATSAGQCSLRAAIQEANARGGTNTITVPAGTYALTITGTGEDAAATGDLDITTGTLTLQGSGNDLTTGTVINANGIDRAFQILAAATANFSNLVIENGHISGDEGGGVYNAGGTTATPVTFTNVTVTANTADNPSQLGNAGDGGGIYNTGVMSLQNTTVSNNISNSNGFSSASNGGGGGGGICNQGTLTVQGSTVTGNTVMYFVNNVGGGGIQNSGGPNIDTSTALVTISSSTISNNAAPSGGGLRNSFGNALIDLTTLDSNTANTGGGLQNSGGSITLNRSTVSNNTATETTGGQNGIGGGISNLTTMNITSSTINNNTADQQGGGIDNTAQGALEMVNSTVTANTANQGGGIYNHLTMNIDNDTVYDNAAPGGGTEIFACGTQDESLDLGCDNDITDATTGLVDIATNILNSIVGNDTTTDNCGGYGPLIVSQGYNIETANSCGFNATGDLINIAFATLFTGPLQNNGGPTFTFAISTSSPAYQAGDESNCPLTDQRGFARNDGGCDIGAYQVSTSNTNFNVVDLSLEVTAALRTTSTTQVVYTVTVTNKGAVPATGTTVIGKLPPWAAIPADGGFPSGNCNTNSEGFQCNLGTLAGISTQQFFVVVDPQESGQLVLNADVTSNQEDSFRPDNLATVTIAVPAGSSLGTVSGNNFDSTESNGSGGGSEDVGSLLGLLAAIWFRRGRLSGWPVAGPLKAKASCRPPP